MDPASANPCFAMLRRSRALSIMFIHVKIAIRITIMITIKKEPFALLLLCVLWVLCGGLI